MLARAMDDDGVVGGRKNVSSVKHGILVTLDADWRKGVYALWGEASLNEEKESGERVFRAEF